MAQTTTSAPQQQVGMPAVDLRQFLWATGIGEGVRTATDLAVAQRAAGANMSVDVAAGTALIQDDHGTGGGFYSYTLATATNVSVTGSDPTNPRVDRVVVRVRDQALGDAANDAVPFVVAGTPTAGATLVNLNGAAAVPASALLLANILIPAASSTVTTANIDTTARLRAAGPGIELARLEVSGGSGPTGIIGTGTGTLLMTLPAFAADGVSAYEVEISMGSILASATGTAQFGVAEGGSMISNWALTQVSTTGHAFWHRVKLLATPSAGPHTYTIQWRGDGATASYTIGNTTSGWDILRARVVKV